MNDKIVKKVENLPQLTAVKRTDKLIQKVAAYMENFESMSAWEMFSDADDLSFVIDRVLVKPDRSIDVMWLDGSVDEYAIPMYTPNGGIK